MAIPEDVQRYIARHFQAGDREEAMRLLAAATIHDGTAAGPRLLRCAVVASKGSMQTLRYGVDLLKIDWRDVIMGGEYEQGPDGVVRYRNFNEPIPEDL